MKWPSTSNLRLLVGVTLGFLIGEQLVNFSNLPPWRTYITVGFGLGLAGVLVVAVLFPGHRLVIKYYLGQLGAYLVSLVIGGWLPVVKGVILSVDFWTVALLLLPFGGVLYIMLVIHNWFDIPHPEAVTILWDSFRGNGGALPDLEGT